MKKKVFALGFFDGVHLGHQALLEQCCRMAAENDAEPAAITFLQHPQSLFTDDPPAMIHTDPDRDRLLRRYGIGHIYKFPVTKEVMSTDWRDFLGELMDCGAAGFVCGHDFRFGHRGEGSAEKLLQFCRERSLPCAVVPEQKLEGVRISSTHIRGLIAEGHMEQAARFLGHPHILSGRVVAGRKVGRTIGVPTANLELPGDVVCPRFGVYACQAVIGETKYPAVTNVGTRPTVGGHHVTVEPWILGFDGDLYDREITLEFHKFLRPEQKFESLEQLRAQIQLDAQRTREILK